jgi:hypothetical protein
MAKSLGSIIISMLGIYIAMWPSQPGSGVACMTRYLHCRIGQRRHQHDSAYTKCHDQVISVAPLPALLGSDITQQLDDQHQHYMTSTTSRHAASSYGTIHHYVWF